MVTYLNAKNKENVVLLGAFMYLIRKAGEELKLEGQLKWRLNSAATHAERAFEGIIDLLDDKGKLEVCNRLRHTELMLVPSDVVKSCKY